ncbi:MAG TPA: PQQ-binding-like beta-propeller repeat protein [Bryobacterales bacterium]|nr:PQQ-binding-like beta-propeller repeat protein [Bryobacterales bacterium]
MYARTALRSLFIFGLVLAAHLTLSAADWPAWRGVNSDGVSGETGLPSQWSQQGENLAWKAPIGGRSTPIVLDGRVCVITLAEPQDPKKWGERVVCLDEKTGKIRWDYRYNIFQTDIPHHRVGWAGLVGDLATGYVYSHGIEGIVKCFDRDGKVVWERSLDEEIGRFSGFGGRTVDPILDGDLVIVSFLTAGWGANFIPRHRFCALDKKTGEIVWLVTPGAAPQDTTYSVPVVRVIDGERLLFTGNGDGGVYALQVATGKSVWGFPFSKRGINSSVVVSRTDVFASHSEENVDGSTAMGRLIHLDAAAVADGKPKEVWSKDGFAAGYASPALLDGILYAVDNSANLTAFDVKTGEPLWVHNVGIAQRGSPVIGDGKLYVADVDGTFHILKLSGRAEPEVLDIETFKNADGSATQINGSPAIANGRVFLMTANDLYAIGSEHKPSDTPKAVNDVPNQAPAGAAVAQIQVVPADVVLAPGAAEEFTARAFDAEGRLIGAADAAWSLEGIKGEVSAGALKVSGDKVPQAGHVVAAAGDIKGMARVSSLPPIPFTEDFESYPEKAVPPGWNAARGRFEVTAVEGNKVFLKSSANQRSWRTTVFFGKADASGYVIEADVYGDQKGRRKPDMGLLSHRYTMALMGNRGELMLRSWFSELDRFSQVMPFEWQTKSWYTIKLQVEPDKQTGKTTVRGKVWKRGEPEPADWTIQAVDEIGHVAGSPGIYGYSAADILYDNIKVTSR